MAIAVINGGRIRYELAGSGPPVVVTPGGRAGLEDIVALRRELEPHFRLLAWDRRNTGASDLYLGRRSEQRQWADDLAALLVELDLAPAWLLGGSAGSRVSYLTAIRHPEVVRGLVLWSVSGGPFSSQVLGYQYHVPYLDAARRGGMAAVAETPFFAARLAENPANAEALRAADPEEFAAALLEWDQDFMPQPDTPVPCATEADLGGIRAPTLVVEGNDLMHPAFVAEAVHRLVPDSVMAPNPWTGEEFTDRYIGRSPETVFALYPRVAPLIVRFVTETEESLRSV